MNAEEMAMEHSTGWPVIVLTKNPCSDAYQDWRAEKERRARGQVLPDYKRKNHNRKKGK